MYLQYKNSTNGVSFFVFRAQHAVNNDSSVLVEWQVSDAECAPISGLLQVVTAKRYVSDLLTLNEIRFSVCSVEANRFFMDLTGSWLLSGNE